MFKNYFLLFLIVIFSNCHQKRETTKVFPDGKINSKYFVKNGKIEGDMLEYNHDGKLVSKKFFKNGLQDGKTEFYFDNGNLREVQYYLNGKRYLSDTIWNEMCRIKDIAQFENGKLNGNFISFDSTGKEIFNAIYRNDTLINVITSLKSLKQ